MHTSPTTIAFLLVCLTLVLAFEFSNGFHDTANAVATVIYTNSLEILYAVAWSRLMNFVGVNSWRNRRRLRARPTYSARGAFASEWRHSGRHARRPLCFSAYLERRHVVVRDSQLKFARLKSAPSSALRWRIRSSMRADLAMAWIGVRFGAFYRLCCFLRSSVLCSRSSCSGCRNSRFTASVFTNLQRARSHRLKRCIPAAIGDGWRTLTAG